MMYTPAVWRFCYRWAIIMRIHNPHIYIFMLGYSSFLHLTHIFPVHPEPPVQVRFLTTPVDSSITLEFWNVRFLRVEPSQCLFSWALQDTWHGNTSSKTKALLPFSSLTMPSLCRLVYVHHVTHLAQWQTECKDNSKALVLNKPAIHF